MSRRVRIGVQLHPQHTDMTTLMRVAGDLDDLGVDSIWVWDHFFPLYGPRDGVHYEAWTTLAGLATRTRRVRVGTLVSAMAYRNPDLLAHMAFTLDEMSGRRLTVGVGAGWAERDFTEYGYDYGTVGTRSRQFVEGVARLRKRLDQLRAEPRVPILVGGGGEKVTLRVAAQSADVWNGFCPAKLFARKNRILDEWCDRVGRDHRLIRRSVLMLGPVTDLDPLVQAGAEEVIIGLGPPFDLTPIRAALRQADRQDGPVTGPQRANSASHPPSA